MRKMFVSVVALAALVSFRTAAQMPECEHDLSRVDPNLDDPYDRLGVTPGAETTQVMTRFRAAVRAYRGDAESLKRLADAYADIRLENASGIKYDDSKLPVVALRRAHGTIYGDPHSGRFTLGYGLNNYLEPVMDANLLVREVLTAEAARARLEKLPVELRKPFEEHLQYFINQIRRVGVEGGFEDVIAAAEYWNNPQNPGHRLSREATKVFVELFGATYAAALTDPAGAEAQRTRHALRGLKLPKKDKTLGLRDQLLGERDPRTFLRKTIYYLRTRPNKAPAEFVQELAELYGEKFLVEPAQFMQHLLYFGATRDWTGSQIDFTSTVDRRVVTEIITNLRRLWIAEPSAVGLPARWYDLASVLWDAHGLWSQAPFEAQQPESPAWVALKQIEASSPEILEAIRREREPPRLPSDILPW